MPNVFDQFDAPGKSANVFDQFGGGKPPSPVAPSANQGGAFFGLMPGVPSVGEQLTAERQRVTSEQQRLGRPLTLAEHLRVNPAMESPVAAGFATHQIGGAGEAVAPALAAANAAKANSLIGDARIVRPTVVGKKTAPQVAAYQAQTRDAVSSIVENKDNLSFADDKGTITGELPKSLEQFSQAIDQTKQKVFEKYDKMVRDAGAKGADVPLGGVSSELQKIVLDPVVQDLHPELAAYAKQRIEAFQKRGQYTLPEAQRAITNLNQSLRAFYRNPSHETAAKANVDALIANQLRFWLDKSIDATLAPGYQDLKNKYGALKAIEENVTKRAQINARNEKGGLAGRLANVFSAEEAIRGILTFSPGHIVRAATIKGASELVRHYRSPDRAVTRLFRAAERAQTPSGSEITPIVPNVPLSPIFPMSYAPSDQDTMQRAASPTQ